MFVFIQGQSYSIEYRIFHEPEARDGPPPPPPPPWNFLQKTKTKWLLEYLIKANFCDKPTSNFFWKTNKIHCQFFAFEARHSNSPACRAIDLKCFRSVLGPLIDRRNLFCILQYGPRTQLIKSIYVQFFKEYVN